VLSYYPRRTRLTPPWHGFGAVTIVASADDRVGLVHRHQLIVNAAVKLHTTVGPARPTVKAIAESAGVERITVYCLGMHREKQPAMAAFTAGGEEDLCLLEHSTSHFCG
jgi:hypothetical protein